MYNLSSLSSISGQFGELLSYYLHQSVTGVRLEFDDVNVTIVCPELIYASDGESTSRFFRWSIYIVVKKENIL